MSVSLSWLAGVASGLNRRAEGPVMALSDLLLALPSIPLYLLVAILLGASQSAVILVLGLLSWPAFARIVRAQVLVTRGQPFVEAARSLGATELRIGMKHVLPATIPLLPAKLILTVRFALFAETTLAFLGLGDPSAKTWGTMLGWAFNYPLLFPSGAWLWWSVPPAMCIALVVVATTWLGDRILAPGGAAAR
jgi:peptide/nickel transport system permease protein